MDCIRARLGRSLQRLSAFYSGRGAVAARNAFVRLFHLKSVLEFMGNDGIAVIDRRRLTEYQQWRLDHGRKPRTINSELGTLGLLFRWAKNERLIRDVPSAEQIPVARTAVEVFTPEEAVAIIETLPARLRTLVRFLAETGCRKGEALHLAWSDIDEVHGWASIHPKDGWTPKTAQSIRSVPLNPGLLAEIRALPKLGPYVFPGRDPRQPMNNFRRALATAVAKAGVLRNGAPMRVTPHLFRKAFATWQNLRGLDDSVLQPMLGHAPGSRVTRTTYIVRCRDDIRRAAFTLKALDLDPDQPPRKNGKRTSDAE